MTITIVVSAISSVDQMLYATMESVNVHMVMAIAMVIGVMGVKQICCTTTVIAVPASRAAIIRRGVTMDSAYVSGILETAMVPGLMAVRQI